MNRRRFIALTTIAPVALATKTAVMAQEAGPLNVADEWLHGECGQMWPSRGFFETNLANGIYEVGYNFTFTKNELAALKCTTPKFEMRFVIGGFINAENAQRHSKFSSDLPGGGKRTFVYDVDNDVTLRCGLFRPHHMSADEYNIQLKFWGVQTDERRNPWVAVQMGMISEEGRRTNLFLSRGQLGDVIHFNKNENGYQYLPFGD